MSLAERMRAEGSAETRKIAEETGGYRTQS
jgi:hypothetical protein